MRLLPTTLQGPDDWISEVTPRDSRKRPFKCGHSRHLTEQQAWEECQRLLSWRKVGPAKVFLRRRWATRNIERMVRTNASR